MNNKEQEMRPFNRLLQIRLLKHYRSRGLGLASAMTRLGKFKSKHNLY
jgi:hypothetical protein